MNARNEVSEAAWVPRKGLWALVFVGAGAFHLAFLDSRLGVMVLVYLGCLVELTRATTARTASYAGLSLGFLVFAPKLGFFYTIFGPAAVPLWGVLALWHGLFVYLGQRARHSFKPTVALALIPMFWTGLEYFRSELYPLRFSWLAPGFALGPNALTSVVGSYGVTLCLLFFVVAISRLTFVKKVAAYAGVMVVLFAHARVEGRNESTGETLEIAGMQLEFPVELEVPGKLDELKRAHPQAEIFVLSEYSFDGPVPKCVRSWCKRNGKYLVAGGKDATGDGNFYNTAFVIGPDGEVVFKQAKAVPIQFFKDGLPAPEQRVWESPWGKVGLATCYDLSYTRVVDVMARQGARLIINPTMDVVDWGRRQHEMHSLIAPMRAAEYGIPIFRVASSGISQAVDARGRLLAVGSFPGEGEIISARLAIGAGTRLPTDRVVAPLCVVGTVIAFGWMFFQKDRWRQTSMFNHQ